MGLQSRNVEHYKKEKEKMKTKKERGTNYNTYSMTMAYRIVCSHHLQQLRNTVDREIFAFFFSLYKFARVLFSPREEMVKI